MSVEKKLATVDVQHFVSQLRSEKPRLNLPLEHLSINSASFDYTTTSKKQTTQHTTHPSNMANILSQVYRFAIPGALAFSFASAALYDVKGGTRVVIFDRLRGVSDQVVNEGTHFLVPWLQKAISFDVRTKPRNISTTTGSKDLQMVSLTLRVLHRPEVGQLPKIYQVSLATSFEANAQERVTMANIVSARTLAQTTTSASYPPSATKSSKQ